jgi:hypothetical protein
VKTVLLYATAFVTTIKGSSSFLSMYLRESGHANLCQVADWQNCDAGSGFLISELVVLAANVIVEMGLHNLEPKREPDRQGASGGKPSRTSSDESDEDD